MIPYLPFQIGAINTALNRKKMLINLPAGSGKSLIALGVANRSGSNRVLIICPSFLKLNWKYEVEKWFSTNVHIVNSIEDTKFLPYTKRIVIVGYSFFERKGNVQKLMHQHWDMVICDESSYLRKWSSRRTKNVLVRICHRKERLLFLTATPLVQSAADLHGIYSVLKPGRFGKFGDFCEKYCIKQSTRFDKKGFVWAGIKNEDKLKELSRDIVFTARESQILKQLPSLRIIDVPLDCGKCEDFDDETVEDFLTRLDSKKDLPEEVKTERERIGKVKIPSVLELIETFGNKQVVIFCHHRSIVREYTLELRKLGFRAECILGGMTEQRRMARVTRFSEGKFTHLVVSISAGGLGLNLQSASIAVFAELPYTWAEFLQCMKRIHRLNSKRSVRIYKPIVVNSIDEKANKQIEYKKNCAELAGVAN